MVKGNLVTALDWSKKKTDPRGQYSYRVNQTWFVVEYGPGFSNSYLVTDHDDAGLRWLEEHERKEEASAEDRAV